MSSVVATSPRRRRLVRFFLVGLTAAAVQLVLLWVFVDIGGVNYLLAAVVAIEATILFQYVLNNVWTFHRSRHTSLREYVVGMCKTNIVRGTAIPLQVGVLYALVALTTTGYLAANAVAIGLTGLYRYVLDARWTWQ
ncbi:GtrA family protein [Haloarcula litorea]|uniref:GtrA family protein n=1 Tax=Haloarcula litorea TaxID=3032579 RepID=UPI0023E757FB|nr:GtrA family protein [Halomicroarcula sp. GDY20]